MSSGYFHFDLGSVTPYFHFTREHAVKWLRWRIRLPLSFDAHGTWSRFHHSLSSCPANCAHGWNERASLVTYINKGRNDRYSILREDYCKRECTVIWKRAETSGVQTPCQCCYLRSQKVQKKISTGWLLSFVWSMFCWLYMKGIPTWVMCSQTCVSVV